MVVTVLVAPQSICAHDALMQLFAQVYDYWRRQLAYGALWGMCPSSTINSF